MTATMKHKHFLSIIFIALSGLIAYSNSFDVPFQFDDKFNILENPAMKDLGYFLDPSRISEFKGSAIYSGLKRRYVGYISFALNYKVVGFDVRGYHAVNLLIHIMNGMLFFWLYCSFFRASFCIPSRSDSGGYIHRSEAN
jgi:hypothetical protein